MAKNLMFCVLILLFTACSSVTYNYKQSLNELNFKLDENKFLKKKLDNTKFVYTFDKCTNDSYLLLNEDIFVENISLQTNCRWNGLSNGFFEYEFKHKLKLKSMESLERIDVKNYHFSTHKINETHRLHIIWIWGAYTDTFIIDYTGKLYQELLSHLKPDYKYTHQGLSPFKADYQESLVRLNFIKGYFNADREVYSK